MRMLNSAPKMREQYPSHHHIAPWRMSRKHPITCIASADNRHARPVKSIVGINNSLISVVVDRIHLNGGRIDRLGVQLHGHRASTWRRISRAVTSRRTVAAQGFNMGQPTRASSAHKHLIRSMRRGHAKFEGMDHQLTYPNHIHAGLVDPSGAHFDVRAMIRTRAAPRAAACTRPQMDTGPVICCLSLLRPPATLSR